MAGAGGAVSDIGSGVSDLFSAAGDFLSGQAYSLASSYDTKSAKITKLATGIQEQQQQRQAFMVLGATNAAVAGSGFENSGSAMDILKSNAQQASLNKALVGEQGYLTQTGYEEAAAVAKEQAKAANMSGIGQSVAGIASIVTGGMQIPGL